MFPSLSGAARSEGEDQIASRPHAIDSRPKSNPKIQPHNLVSTKPQTIAVSVQETRQYRVRYDLEPQKFRIEAWMKADNDCSSRRKARCSSRSRTAPILHFRTTRTADRVKEHALFQVVRILDGSRLCC